MEVKFHDIGEGMTEGEVLTYFVELGDDVSVDQPLVEMQTDKMVAEIPSPVAGRITAINFEVGETVTVGTTIIEIDGGKEQQDNKTIAASKQVTKVDTVSQTEHHENLISSSTTAVLAAPYTRKIARDHNIDIELLQGTGPDGRVMEEDVHDYLTEVESEVGEVKLDKQADTLPFKGIRKQIAKNMSHSVQTIPHVTHYEEIDVTALMELRKELKEMDLNVSIVTFFLKALGVALQEYPIFNAELDEGNEVIRLYEEINIGLATDTASGLVVPVLKNIEAKSLQSIDREMKTFTEKAQTGKLERKDMSGGTFTVSNVGPLGGVGATPIINHPQSAIMAFHKTKKMPVVLPDDQVAVRSIMNVSLSFDHRIADGADSVRFTNRFAELIEEPKKLFMELT